MSGTNEETMSADFLIEIGTEELPPKALLRLSNAFRDEILSQLKAEQLSFDKVESFASPRRLAVTISNLEEQTPTKEVVAWGPPIKVAFDDDGKPTRAAEAFASKNGIAVNDLKNNVDNDGKQDKLCFRATEAGQKDRRTYWPHCRNSSKCSAHSKKNALGSKPRRICSSHSLDCHAAW